MPPIALHTSSFVGKQRGYHPANRWAECVSALSDYYAPPETFAERFDALLGHVRSLGYTTLDVWQPGILNWQWAAEEHLRAARGLLDQQAMRVSSYAGEFGETREEFLAACRAARAIGAPLLSGMTALWAKDPEFVSRALEDYHLRLALENHPERSAQEMLDQIRRGDSPRVGTAIDTGWYATRGCDVPQAIRDLRGHILHVHLKDVLPGPEHINCGLGKGCVPVADSLHALRSMHYDGVISIEEHTLDHDPDDELRAARGLVEQMISETEIP